MRSPRALTSRAFTLLEVLTSTAVLAIVLVMMFQVTDGIQRSTRLQNQQMDSVAAARRALDVIVADLQTAVIGPFSALLGNTTASSGAKFAVLTSRRGPSGAAGHRFLSARYSHTPAGELWRAYNSVSFNGTANLLAAAAAEPAAANQPLAEGVLAFRCFAVTRSGAKFDITIPAGSGAEWAAQSDYNGLAVPGGWQAVVTASSQPLSQQSGADFVTALEVWVAAVDPQTLDLLQTTGALASAQSALAGAPAVWRQTFDTAALPASAKSALRILNRTVPLP